MENLTFPDSGPLLQGVLHAADQWITINIQKFLSDDVPHGIRGLLKEFE